MVATVQETASTSLTSLVRAMRPRQWVKNVLVATAPLAAGQIDESSVLLGTIAAIACFCAASSAVYLLNDVRDVAADRLHPVKMNRPIAAGLVSARAAVVTAAVLAMVALVGAGLLDLGFLSIVATYLALQVAYGFGLKHQPVLDIAVVASGFLLRAVSGGLATDIPLSQWFLMVAGFGSLYMIAGKRYSELLQLGSDTGTRKSLAGYTETYLRFVWNTAAAVTMTGYCLWAFSLPTGTGSGIAWEEISIVPFVLGIMRYAIDVDAGEAGEPEDIVLRDRVLQVLGLLWLVLVGLGVFGA
jgi:decaprenyl-phosphate phosphoribosyltransferase